MNSHSGRGVMVLKTTIMFCDHEFWGFKFIQQTCNVSFRLCIGFGCAFLNANIVFGQHYAKKYMYRDYVE